METQSHSVDSNPSISSCLSPACTADILAYLDRPRMDPNVMHGGRPLIRSASFYADPRCVLRLLASGADPNLSGASGQTALMAAAEFDRPCVIKMLLEFGAVPSLRDARGRSAIDYAQRFAGVEACNLLS